jgi:LysM repeat protein
MKCFWSILTLFLLLSFSLSTVAQVNDAEIKTRDGKQFYVHVVQQGNTLWGLHTTYDVPVEAIVKENPGIETTMAIGQLVWIPIVKTSSTNEDTVIPNEDITHLVTKGETLYGISRKYQLSVDELLLLNPSAADGISIDQLLVIKKGVKKTTSAINTPIQVNKNNDTTRLTTKLVFNDSIVEHTVLAHETLYSISKRFMIHADTLARINSIKNNKIKTGDVLQIPLKKERVEHVQIREIPLTKHNKRKDTTLFSNSSDTFNIAILLPMNYDLNGSIYGISPNAEMNRYTKVATEFYMGIRFALDSLKNLGLNANVTLFDTKADSITTEKVLQKMSSSHWDLVIGPLMPAPSKAVANWAKKTKTPVLSPVPVPVVNLKENNYIFASVPSDNRLLEGMADELVKNHSNDNIILINSGLKSDANNYEIVRKRINSKLTPQAFRGVLKEANLGSTTGKDLANLIQKDKVTIFIVPSSNRVFAANFMTTMNKVRNMSKTYEEADIRVYALKEWDSFDEIKLNYKRRLNLHYPSAISLNYEQEKMTAFIQNYRDHYQTDPNKYALQGFDVTLHFINTYLLKSKSNTEGLINAIQYTSKGEGNGHENSNVFIVRYNNYVIEEADRIHE